MSYAAQANRPNPAAIVGALGVPGAIAALLVTGLAIKGVIAPDIDNPIATNFEVPKIEAIPDPVVEPETQSSNIQNPADKVIDTVQVRPDSSFDFDLGPTAPVGTLPDLGSGLTGDLRPVDFGIPTPTPSPAFSPKAAAPRGNPGGWITDNDYRTSWINRGYTGVAGFALTIDTDGRVTGCTITQSTGHSVLDEATCRLLERRARFDPAKDSGGNQITGTYRSSVNWQIPR